MRLKIIFTFLFIALLSFTTKTFKKEQLRYPRVRQAYKEKESLVSSMLSEKHIAINSMRVYLRAFKEEQEIELWAKNETDDQFRLIKIFEVCNSSGKLGPKRKQGDRQIPEGFYHINRFNPYSNFYLSLGINYPNKSDEILGDRSNLGGDIFIHGACVTIGCLPITDDLIKELYVYCVEARSNGQLKIPVTIFPARLSESNFKQLSEKYSADAEKIGLWKDLKKGYEIFNESKVLPTIGFLSSGRHSITR